MSRKVTEKYENPIDNYLYDVAEALHPYFYKLNFTPNGITTLSLITGIASIYYMYNKKFIQFAILYFISYFFDCADGSYARKYKMVSKFGDLYDHFKDWSVSLIGLWVLFSKYKLGKNLKLIIPIAIMIPLLIVHIGCQEKMYGKNESETLEISKRFCPANTKNELEYITQYTRFAGCGTFVLFQILIVYLLMK
tara:strand:- start:7 stop:588 length:582 start_codon:yes stop_codon:yes gene_type:complete